MPRVPEEFAPSVSQSEMPMAPATGPWVSPMRNSAPGLLQQTGETLARAGAMETQLGNTIGDRIEETVDDANAKNAETTFLKSAMGVVADYSHKLGNDAIQGYAPATQAITKAKQDVLESLTNPIQQHMFATVATQHLLNFGRQMDDHRYQQTVLYGTQAANDRADNLVQLAANSYADWQRPDGDFARNKALAVGEAAHAASLQGLPADSAQTKALVKQKTSALAQGVLMRMMNNEQYPEAQSYLDKANAAGEIDERAYEMLANAVMEGHNSQKASRLADAARQISLGAPNSTQQRMPPVAGGAITSTMGAPRPGNRSHDGIDIAVPVGTKVQAPADGTVSKVWNDDKFGGGLSMEISYPDGSTEGFAHLSAANYQPGQKVTQGSVVALTGQTGDATGPVLHWAMKDSAGNWVDPRAAAPAPQNPDDFTDPNMLEKGVDYINGTDATDRVKNTAIAKLRSQYNLAREMQSQKYQAVKQQAVDLLVGNGGNYDALPAAVKASLHPGDQWDFQARARGMTEEEQRQASIPVLANWIEHPEQQTVSAVKEAYAKGQLTQEGYLTSLHGAMAIAADAQNSDQEKVIGVSVDNQQIENTLIQNGHADLTGGKLSPDLQAKKVALYSEIKDQIDAEQQVIKRGLTREQKQQIIDHVIINSSNNNARFLTLPGFFSSHDVAPWELPPAAAAHAKYTSSTGQTVDYVPIPMAARSAAVQSLIQRRQPITEENIYDTWVNAGMPGARR